MGFRSSFGGNGLRTEANEQFQPTPFYHAEGAPIAIEGSEVSGTLGIATESDGALTLTPQVIAITNPTYEPTWLLEIVWAGRSWRWASRAIEVETDRGEFREYHSGLEIDLTEQLALLSEVDGDRSISLDLDWPEDVAQLVEDGWDLAGATGELSLLYEGETWEKRRVMLLGECSSPAYETETDPVSFTLAETMEDRGLVLDDLGIVSDDTFPNADPATKGRAVPFVFGRPGAGDEGTSGSPGLYVDTTADRIAIARHRVRAVLVTLFDVTSDDGAGRRGCFPVEHDFDDTGAIYAYVVPNSGSLTEINAGQGHEYWVKWDGKRLPYTGASGPDPSPGDIVTGLTSAATGVISKQVDTAGNGYLYVDLVSGTFEDGETLDSGSWSADYAQEDPPDLDGHPGDGEGLGGAGSLLRHMLRRGTRRFDAGRMASLVPELDGFRVGGYIDDQCSPGDWIEDHLMPLLPLSFSSGPDGLTPILTRFEVQPEDATFELEVGRNCSRAGPVQYQDVDPLNVFTLNYCMRARTREFKRTKVLNAKVIAYLASVGIGLTGLDDQGYKLEPGAEVGGELSETSDTARSVYARSSAMRYGVRADDPVDTEIVYEGATADRILSWWMLAKGFRRRELTVDLDVLGSEPPRIGEIGLLTDEELHLDEALVRITRVSWDNLDPSVTLLILDDPMRRLPTG